jgi:hypothetical protein
MQIQDARFERKPYFTIEDIVDDPFAGGIAAFGAITDNYFIPSMEGVKVDNKKNLIFVTVLMVNSLGMIQLWRMSFKAKKNIDNSLSLMLSPKEELKTLSGDDLETAIGNILNDSNARKRFRLFFNNEYYPSLIPVRHQMVLLHQVVDALIERGALSEHDREIIDTTERLAPEWFTH